MSTGYEVVLELLSIASTVWTTPMLFLSILTKFLTISKTMPYFQPLQDLHRRCLLLRTNLLMTADGSDISWTDLLKAMNDDTSFTTSLLAEDISTSIESLNKYYTDSKNTDSPAGCFGFLGTSPKTGTTSMSYTTAPSLPDGATAPYSMASLLSGELLQTSGFPMNGLQTGGQIVQSISTNRHDKIFSSTLQKTSGDLRSHEINSMFGAPGPDGRTDSILDVCNKGHEVHHTSSPAESTSGLNASTNFTSGTKDSQTPRRQSGGKKQRIVQFFFKHPTSPILSIVKTTQWLNSEIAYIGRSHDMFKHACDIFCRQICNYCIEDFANLYHKSNPLFGAVSGKLDKEYYSREESHVRLEELLLFQFQDIDRICDFLKIIYSHLNRNSGKKNCIQLTGPPSSGKTYFVNILSSFCLSKGQIRNFNKFDTFPLNDCVDKRILLWDEPNYERGALEQIKLLFSGDKCPANVKYENQVQIDRTPIYVTCNNDIFPNNEEFNCHMYKFEWQTLPDRSTVVKQIYPIAIYDLFVKYGVIMIT